GLGRLWVNDRVIARTPPHAGQADGHEPVPPVPEPPLPGMRAVGYGDREVFGEADIGADGRCRVILEVLVGGKQFRPEPGEMCVAVQPAPGEIFVLLQPAGAGLESPEGLSDVGWDRASGRIEAALVAFDDLNRRRAAASRNGYWEQRQARAR